MVARSAGGGLKLSARGGLKGLPEEVEKVSHRRFFKG